MKSQTAPYNWTGSWIHVDPPATTNQSWINHGEDILEGIAGCVGLTVSWDNEFSMDRKIPQAEVLHQL